VDADKNQAGIQELKEWVGAMEYLKSFPDTNGDGLPDIPDKYRGRLGRIVREASFNPISLLSRGTILTWMAFFTAVLFIIIIAALVFFISKKASKRRSSTDAQAE